MSDTSMDYPLGIDVIKAMDTVKAKFISSSFEEQLFAAEELYGNQLFFSFTKNDVAKVLTDAAQYPPELRQRVAEIIYQQMRKFEYLMR